MRCAVSAFAAMATAPNPSFSSTASATQRFLRIGRSPDWSLKAARTRAKELRSILDQGRDPAADQGDRRGIATVERFLRYISEASWDHGTTKEPEKRNHLIGWRGVGQIYSGDPTLRERAGDATLFSGGASVVALPAAIRLIDETPPLVLTG